jgi:murein DD-endopeptidase MepM/ murein hydrolase activator NlpD
MRFTRLSLAAAFRNVFQSEACPKNAGSVHKKDTSRHFGLWTLAGVLSLSLSVFVDDSHGRSSSRETLIRISTEREGSSTHLYVQNVQAADVTVTFEMDLVNLDATEDFPHTLTVAGKQRMKLFTLSPRDTTRGWSWSYTYYSTFGSTTAKHDDKYIYTLPYAPGRSYKVSQGYNGEYSHFGADQYAIDWRMPLGSPIHAARGGVVVGVKSDSNVGGNSSKYDWDANYILIQHSDGTLGQYVHLLKDGSKVKVGQRVQSGELIGLSGNTGHSTGPHLHFSVFKAKDGKHRQTIPVKYRTADQYAVTLQEGRTYKAATVGSTMIAASEPSSSAMAEAERVGKAEPATAVGSPNQPTPVAVGR